jgi:hypothetical protein
MKNRKTNLRNISKSRQNLTKIRWSKSGLRKRGSLWSEKFKWKKMKKL